MKNIILVLALAYLTISTVIIQSNVGDLTTFSNTSQPAVQNTYPYNVSISQAPSAVWIYSSNWNNSATPSPLTVTEQFYASCGSTMTLYATSDNNFTVTINGNTILNGSDWRTVFSTTFTPVCGVNNFSITAYNYGVGSPINPAGILYAIIQDPSSCYSCAIGQNWDPTTCSCTCADHCDCVAPQVWTGFPSCQCSCVQTVACSQNYYYNQNSCSCKCLPTARVKDEVEVEILINLMEEEEFDATYKQYFWTFDYIYRHMHSKFQLVQGGKQNQLDNIAMITINKCPEVCTIIFLKILRQILLT